MKKNVVVFDFDGVIIDSWNLQRIAFSESYKRCVGDTKDRFQEFIAHAGSSIEQIFKSMRLPYEMIPIYKDISSKNIHLIKLYDGIERILETLMKNDIKICLCTGKDRIRTMELLKELKIFHFFHSVVCSDDVENPKPHPESLLRAIEDCGGTPERSVMVGDSINDLLCAKRAGVVSVGVLWGEGSGAQMKKLNPNYLCHNMNELHNLLMSLTGI